MTNNPANTPVSFMDDPHAPELFADSVTGYFLFNGNLRLTLESARVEHSASPGPVNRVVIGRIVMPVSSARALKDMLVSLFDQQPPSTSAQIQGTPTLQ